MRTCMVLDLVAALDGLDQAADQLFRQVHDVVVVRVRLHRELSTLNQLHAGHAHTSPAGLQGTASATCCQCEMGREKLVQSGMQVQSSAANLVLADIQLPCHQSVYTALSIETWLQTALRRGGSRACLVELAGGELGVVGHVNGLVAELLPQLVHAVQAACAGM